MVGTAQDGLFARLISSLVCVKPAASQTLVCVKGWSHSQPPILLGLSQKHSQFYKSSPSSGIGWTFHYVPFGGTLILSKGYKMHTRISLLLFLDNKYGHKYFSPPPPGPLTIFITETALSATYPTRSAAYPMRSATYPRTTTLFSWQAFSLAWWWTQEMASPTFARCMRAFHCPTSPAGWILQDVI